MKIKTSNATPCQIDWLVAKCLGYPWMWSASGTDKHMRYQVRGKNGGWERFYPSSNWAQAGSIIDAEIIERGLLISSRLGRCEAVYPNFPQWETYHGETPLIAALRCYVASHMGAEVDIPDEL